MYGIVLAVVIVGASGGGRRPVETPADSRVEVGVVPLAGGDTDVGFGVGQLSNVARVSPQVTPYIWRVESAAFISFKSGASVGSEKPFISPYQDIFFVLTIPRIIDQRLRLELRPSFTRETTQRFYGLGNASVAPPGTEPERDFYGRGHPTLSLRLRWALGRRLFIEGGQLYTQNWFDVPDNGILVTKMKTGTETERRLLGDVRSHGVYLSELSLIWDSREDEISPLHGQFHQLRLRASPRLGAHLPYAYQQANLTLRFYLPMIPKRVRLATRTVFDGQFGDVPFYEMARYDDTFALGGLNGVRGVPGQRYYGKVKAFANIELRSRLVTFDAFGQEYILGSVVFFDFGRLWADWKSNPELDGTSWGLKYGTGGGLRLQQGQTFVVRADIAWSPDARPFGAYVSAGQTF